MTRLGWVIFCLKNEFIIFKNYVCYRDGVYPSLLYDNVTYLIKLDSCLDTFFLVW